MTTNDDIRAYYAGFAEREWLRLTRPGDGQLEFAITCAVLAQYLPSHARVLDIGGGPGRYTIWLAQQGHRVVLGDLSPDLVAIARAGCRRWCCRAGRGARRGRRV